MGSQEHKTRVVQDNLNPVWDSQMQFTVKDPQQEVLCISVYDRDLFSPNGKCRTIIIIGDYVCFFSLF